MLAFLIYVGKVAVALAVFYMFYRLLLRKETFHRMNRIVLVGSMVLAFVIPLCIITIHRPMVMDAQPVEQTLAVAAPASEGIAPAAEASHPWWPAALAILYFAGVVFMLARVVISILSIRRIVRRGQLVSEEDGCKIIVTGADIDPFSWMKYIVLSTKDWEGEHGPIITHEKAHIGYKHSVELLAVNVLSAFQWFNPVTQMLRSDLQEVHEYEADDAVLRSGANLKEYQYLLIRKAVSKSGYSVANSFNHSILKNRITMMSKSKSPLKRGLRVLWVFPLVCLAVGLQAQTVYVQQDKDSEKIVSAEPDGIVLIVSVDKNGNGVVSCDGKDMAISDVAEYIRGLDLPIPGTTVHIAAASNISMGFIIDVKDQLREARTLKVKYVSPTGSDDVIRYMPPMPKKTEKKAKRYPDELLPGVDRENIFIVRINSLDKYFFGNAVGVDDEDMVKRGKDFLEERGANAVFSLMCDRGTSYGAYYHIQSLLIRVYSELRNQKAQALYGKSLAELSPEELEAVYKIYPITISESN